MVTIIDKQNMNQLGCKNGKNVVLKLKKDV